MGKKPKNIISSATLEHLQNKKRLLKELLAGKSIQEIWGFSESKMAKFYKSAYLLLSEQKFEEAVDAFVFLVTISPTHSEYWMGLGTALEFCHNYEEAIDAFEIAAIFNLYNPWPYFYLGKCLFAIHDRKGAKQAIELAIEYAKEDEAYQDLLFEALKAKKTLLKS